MRTASICSLTLLLLAACQTTDDDGFTVIDRGVCDALIECAVDLAPQSRDQFIATYGEGGSCWQGGPSQWAACRAACEDSINALNLIGQASGQSCDGAVSDGESSDGESSTDESSTDESSTDESSTDESSTDETGETGEGCYSAPEECLRFIDCIGQIVPEQQQAAQEMYGEGASCWCNGDAQAQECYATCVAELDNAIESFPTAQMCHENWCSLGELDPSQPYGPVTNGSCPSYNGTPQLPLTNPFGLPGSVCAPPCSGLAMACPDHSQTSADGTCYLTVGDTDYCVSRCYVDSTIFPSAAQCQCGATCQPHGPADGEGNLRGICTFE